MANITELLFEEEGNTAFTNPEKLQDFDKLQPTANVEDIDTAVDEKINSLKSTEGLENLSSEQTQNVVNDFVNLLEDTEEIMKTEYREEDDKELKKEIRSDYQDIKKIRKKVDNLKDSEDIEPVLNELLSFYYKKHNRRAKLLSRAAELRDKGRENRANRKIEKANEINDLMLKIVEQIDKLAVGGTEEKFKEKVKDIEPRQGEDVTPEVNKWSKVIDDFKESGNNLNKRSGDILKDFGSKGQNKKGKLHDLYKKYTSLKDDGDKVLETEEGVYMLDGNDVAFFPKFGGSFSSAYQKAREQNAIMFVWDSPESQWPLYSTLGQDEAVTSKVKSPEEVKQKTKVGDKPSIETKEKRSKVVGTSAIPATTIKAKKKSQPLKIDKSKISQIVNTLYDWKWFSDKYNQTDSGFGIATSYFNTDEDELSDFMVSKINDGTLGVNGRVSTKALKQFYMIAKNKKNENVFLNLVETFDAENAVNNFNSLINAIGTQIAGILETNDPEMVRDINILMDKYEEGYVSEQNINQKNIIKEFDIETLKYFMDDEKHAGISMVADVIAGEWLSALWTGFKNFPLPTSIGVLYFGYSTIRDIKTLMKIAGYPPKIIRAVSSKLNNKAFFKTKGGRAVKIQLDSNGKGKIGKNIISVNEKTGRVTIKNPKTGKFLESTNPKWYNPEEALKSSKKGKILAAPKEWAKKHGYNISSTKTNKGIGTTAKIKKGTQQKVRTLKGVKSNISKKTNALSRIIKRLRIPKLVKGNLLKKVPSIASKVFRGGVGLVGGLPGLLFTVAIIALESLYSWYVDDSNKLMRFMYPMLIAASKDTTLSMAMSEAGFATIGSLRLLTKELREKVNN